MSRTPKAVALQCATKTGARRSSVCRKATRRELGPPGYGAFHGWFPGYDKSPLDWAEALVDSMDLAPACGATL